jgi:hypothetical protein
MKKFNDLEKEVYAAFVEQQWGHDEKSAEAFVADWSDDLEPDLGDLSHAYVEIQLDVGGIVREERKPIEECLAHGVRVRARYIETLKVIEADAIKGKVGHAVVRSIKNNVLDEAWSVLRTLFNAVTEDGRASDGDIAARARHLAELFETDSVLSSEDLARYAGVFRNQFGGIQAIVADKDDA